MYSVRFQKAEESSRSAGAKGMNLIKLTKNGLPVPGGFIIQTNALTRFMEDNGLQADQEQMERAIMNGTFSKELREELTASFYELRESYASVAVRSSSASEDLEGASFAPVRNLFKYQNRRRVSRKSERMLGFLLLGAGQRL